MSNRKYAGKTLLMLGSNVASTDIVEYAAYNGAHTIVADFYPPERSAAKRVAHESVLISTADLEALSTLIIEKKVDAILSGISEFNILQAMKLAEKHNLPFYCTREQWDSIEKKDLFRKLCIHSGVPCPETYFTGKIIPEDVWDNIEYPVVIKPVDACASSGVYICYNEEELRVNEEYARKASGCGEIIIEEFAYGEEFTAHYTITNGEVTLSSVDNRYPVAVHEGRVTTIPVARLYPCLYLDEYIKQVDTGMKRLCKNLDIEDAILFIQGIYNKDKNAFYVFEAGLRSAGEAPYRIIKRVNGINALEPIIDHAFGVKSKFDHRRDDPALNGKCCGIVSFVARHGKVGQIIGLEEAIAVTNSVMEYECRYPVGSVTPDTDTLRQLMIRFVMICNSREDMAKDIAYLNEHITVLDDHGNNMVIKMDPSRVFDIL